MIYDFTDALFRYAQIHLVSLIAFLIALVLHL